MPRTSQGILMHFFIHATRLARIMACCDVPKGCLAVWNNHEALNYASLQSCFHISWANFAPFMTFCNFSLWSWTETLKMHRFSWLSSTPFPQVLCLYLWHSKNSTTKICSLLFFFRQVSGAFLSFSLLRCITSPPGIFCLELKSQNTNSISSATIWSEFCQLLIHVCYIFVYKQDVFF